MSKYGSLSCGAWRQAMKPIEASVIADEYIPIKPASDTPLLLAMAYIMLKEDSPENPTID